MDWLAMATQDAGESVSNGITGSLTPMAPPLPLAPVTKAGGGISPALLEAAGLVHPAASSTCLQLPAPRLSRGAAKQAAACVSLQLLQRAAGRPPDGPLLSHHALAPADCLDSSPSFPPVSPLVRPRQAGGEPLRGGLKAAAAAAATAKRARAAGASALATLLLDLTVVEIQGVARERFGLVTSSKNKDALTRRLLELEAGTQAGTQTRAAGESSPAAEPPLPAAASRPRGRPPAPQTAPYVLGFEAWVAMKRGWAQAGGSGVLSVLRRLGFSRRR